MTAARSSRTTARSWCGARNHPATPELMKRYKDLLADNLT